MANGDMTQPAPAVPVAPAAPAAPVAPDIQDNPVPSVDLTAGTPQPNLTTAVEGSMQPYLNAEQAALQKATQLANTPAPGPAPHARLLAMIQGLGIGLSAAGTAIATHGREGGAPEVQQFRASQQEQKRADQQAAQALRNSQIQQQVTVADTNHKLAQNVLFMATLPNVLKDSDVRVQTEEQTLAENKANFAASHGGMSAEEFQQALAGTGPATGPLGAQVNPFFKTTADQQLQSATKILGADDPYVQQLQTTLANPNATPQELWTATQRVQSQQALQEKATDAQVKKDTAFQNSVVGKLSTPEALAAPGAQAAIQAQIDSPTTTPQDRVQLQLLLPKATVAQANMEAIKAREARTQQLITQGDPKLAGDQLAHRWVTLSELKSRQVTPQFIEAAVAEARKIDPNFRPADADAQAKIAGSQANQQFFGNTDSLLIRGGTLDQLQDAYNALPDELKTQITTWNNMADVAAAAAGSGPLAKLAAIQLGVADDYGKVMGAGNASDTARYQAKSIVELNHSPSGMAGAIAGIRSTVTSQRNGRIGQNPYMKDMYPDPTTVQEAPGVAGTEPGGAPTSGKQVSLAAARQLPINKGKTDDQIRADIQAHGHTVVP